MEPISPELALVDEELERSARDALPDAPDCLTPPGDTLERAAMPRRRRGPAKFALAGVVLLLLALTLGAYTFARGSGGDRDVDASAQAPTGRGGSPGQAEGPAQLRWRRVPRAAFYNVIFWRNGVRALDLWPKAASVRLPENRLAPGRYEWFVYPAFGEGDKQRYGRVVARGTIEL